MSWVKKVWNRMFQDEIEEEIEQEYEAPVEQKSTHVPFRFPLITDEEREIFLKKEQSGEKVTMAEVREELIRRPSQMVQQPVRSEIRPEPKPVQSQSPRQPVQRQSQVSNPTWEDSKPEPIKRRFEPTKVPSPIHGFNEPKPAPIEKLLEQKERKEEFHKAISPVQENAIENKAENSKADKTEERLAVEREIAPEEITSQPAISEIIEQEPAEQSLLPAQEEEAAYFAEPEKVAEHNTAHIGNVEKRDEIPAQAATLPVQSEELSPAAEPLNDAESPPPDSGEQKPVHKDLHQEKNLGQTGSTERKKEKTVPFNVLMLKSDKEKSKIRNVSPMKQQPTISQNQNRKLKRLPR